jgi:ubiquinone/menaquinone biosynthesis C-methylase UbiE
VTDYALTVSDVEVERYRFMAESARESESDLWAAAGIVSGAHVADVGCGPAAMSVVMAEVVGPTGRVVGVERDESALAAAKVVVDRSDVSNVELRQASAEATGLEPGSLDVVVMRHVLAHNGPGEQAIVDHLATLVRPGGSVYLVDIDGTGARELDFDPDLKDLQHRYIEFHRRRGNDLMVGLRLGKLLTRAGLEVVTHVGRYTIISPPPGLRPPNWAAREAMLAEGVVTPEDVDRWERAFERADAQAERPTLLMPLFMAIGRQS